VRGQHDERFGGAGSPRGQGEFSHRNCGARAAITRARPRYRVRQDALCVGGDPWLGSPPAPPCARPWHQPEETMIALRSTPLLIGVLAAALALASCGTQSGRLGTPDPTAPTAPVVLRSTSIGEVLATSRGMTLYIHDRDRFNRSQCTAACARQFAPFLATEGAQPAGDFALARREDGGLQWTHRGRPLYTFSGDAAPGDVTGLGAGPDWRPARF
jgi:predicted lipoprotein with Yx(FWY)xxD motif